MTAEVVAILAIVLSFIGAWELIGSYESGIDLLPGVVVIILAILVFGFAYGTSRFGAFSVQDGVMMFELPIYLGRGRRIRRLALESIDYVMEDPIGASPTKVRVVLKDSTFFWISAAGLPPGGSDFLRVMVSAFPMEKTPSSPK
jgi:hypothetical protein